ncbi:MAG: twin-arginine translocation signal domain-containing protein [Candidatus Poribacteria bacterium]|nr:twin-arginine translocation signal domain-containing protein [Candidatus Poribacteria bacterium]
MNAVKRCDGISRRDFLRVGGLTALGLGLGDFFHLQRAFAVEARSPRRNTQAKPPTQQKQNPAS